MPDSRSKYKQDYADDLNPEDDSVFLGEIFICQKRAEEQAKEFIARRRAEALQADEAFDKEHGLDSIEDTVERARRRAELRREEFEANRKKMLESNPQMAEFEKRAEESRKKFEERREASRQKFEERRKQREAEFEASQKEF